MEISLRSQRLCGLFAEVLQKIPPKERDAIAGRALLITDKADFLYGNQRPTWAAVICLKYRKCIPILYLRSRKLLHEAEAFVRYVIAYHLAHVLCGHHEQLFLHEGLPGEVKKQFDAEVRLCIKRWGIAEG